MTDRPVPGRPRRLLRLGVLWAAVLWLAYAGLGERLALGIEGLDPALVPLWPAAAAVGGLLAALFVTLRPPREAPAGNAAGGVPATASPAAAGGGRHPGRRRFLRIAAGVVAGGGAFTAATFLRLRGWLTVTAPAIRVEVVTTDPDPQPAWKEARVERYRPLGRTGTRVSDISLGSGRIHEENDGEAIARRAIERGVNYFDTSPDYSGTGSERALGRAMAGRRDRMFVATKFCTPDGHLPAGSPVGDYVAAVEGSLRRLRTDYVDLVHIHSCDGIDRLLDPNVHEAFDRLREQGKARFLGVSTHTPKLEEIAGAAIESGRFDVMMLAYHHGAWPRLAALVDRAAASGIGVVAMKTLKGAKHANLAPFRERTAAYSQAAFRWVLSNPSVSCLVVSFFEHQHVDEYLAASGRELAGRDLALLEGYDELVAGTNCLPHCGECLDSCPEALPIHDVLRYRMYAEDYRWPEEGRRLYRRLERSAEACLGCPAPCAGTCPVGIPIRARMLGAHALLA